MTVTLPHVPPQQALRSPFASLVGDVVWCGHVDHDTTVHRTADHLDTRTVALRLSAGDALVLGVTYCPVCWPGRRCKVCGRPSGLDGECGPCVLDAIDAEKRREVAA